MQLFNIKMICTNIIMPFNNILSLCTKLFHTKMLSVFFFFFFYTFITFGFSDMISQ